MRSHVGSPLLVVNTTDGTVAQELAYDEFGRVLLDTNPGFQPGLDPLIVDSSGRLVS